MMTKNCFTTVTNNNPYVDRYDNNEEHNINTLGVHKVIKSATKFGWDTTQFNKNNKDNIQTKLESQMT